MNYIFKGKLCGRICSECLEPLSHVKVRLYRIRKDQKETALATANPKDTFAILTDAMVGEKASFLIAETETDNEGNYTFELGEQQDYDGEAFEVDVYLEKVPGQKEGGKSKIPFNFLLPLSNRSGDEQRKDTFRPGITVSPTVFSVLYGLDLMHGLFVGVS